MMFRHLLLMQVFSPDGSTGGAGMSPVVSASGSTGAPAGGAALASPATFAETLPEGIRGEAAFKDIKSLDDLAKGYLNAQKLIGVPPEQILRLPTTDDPEAWKTVWQRLGRPDSPDKYEGLADPQGATVDPRFKQAFLQQAHDAGLSARQAKSLFDWYNSEAAGAVQSRQQAAEQRVTQSVQTLKTEWGTAFDQKLSEARAALQHYGDNDLVAFLDESGHGNDPRVLRAFAKLGAQLREDGLIGAATSRGLHSPTEAIQQINALKGDAAFTKAYTDSKHPGHADAVTRMRTLYEQAYPS